MLESHRALLWKVCYRMTGSAADADDLVQETFARALERPPADQGRELRPWLLRVAINLSRDQLRARKRRGYAGSWLPSPQTNTRMHSTPGVMQRNPTSTVLQPSLQPSPEVVLPSSHASPGPMTPSPHTMVEMQG